MAILMNIVKSRAIKKIAKALPPLMVSGYGHAGPYTQGQIDTAVAKTGCNADYVAQAYKVLL